MKETIIELIRIIVVALSSILSWLKIWEYYLGNDFTTLLIVLIGGYPVFREAYRALRVKQITMEVAMTIGVSASLLVGEYTAASIIILFTLSAEFIEEQTLERGRKAIEALTSIAPKKALVKLNGEEKEVDVKELKIGDTVVVKPGNKIPVDGIIKSGEASVNQAPITGESIPVDKHTGEEVFAGTVTQSGVIEVEVKKLGEDTTFGRIVKLVEESEAFKAPIQRFADRFASRFVPLVLLASLTDYLITRNATTAISIMVVACPCAISVAMPLAVIASVGKAARKGIIIKGGAHLEELSKVDTVVFDKTGTLTLGELRVVNAHGFLDHSEEEVIQLGAVSESHSEHPLGRAITKKAREKGIEVPLHESCEIIAGKGVVCHYLGSDILLGNRELLYGRGVKVTEEMEHYMVEREIIGETPMLLAHDGHACGVISVSDVIREDAAEGLNQLRSLGVKRFIMLTGDNPRTARMVADKLQIEEVYAEMLPQDKVAKVRELVKGGSRVLMVGDGVNDAPALAEANVGVAMGVAGSDIALETADVALMTDNFLNIAESIKLSRRALGIARQNIYGSFFFNVVGLSLASLGFLTPFMAAVAHVLPDVVLFVNSSRLVIE